MHLTSAVLWNCIAAGFYPPNASAHVVIASRRRVCERIVYLFFRRFSKTDQSLKYICHASVQRLIER